MIKITNNNNYSNNWWTTMKYLFNTFIDKGHIQQYHLILVSTSSAGAWGSCIFYSVLCMSLFCFVWVGLDYWRCLRHIYSFFVLVIYVVFGHGRNETGQCNRQNIIKKCWRACPLKWIVSFEQLHHLPAMTLILTKPSWKWCLICLMIPS